MIGITKKQPPKDRPFIGLFTSSPWATIAIWSPADNGYTYTSLAASMYHGKDEFYFENEWSTSAGKLIAWEPLPEVSIAEYREFQACAL